MEGGVWATKISWQYLGMVGRSSIEGKEDTTIPMHYDNMPYPHMADSRSTGMTTAASSGRASFATENNHRVSAFHRIMFVNDAVSDALKKFLLLLHRMLCSLFLPKSGSTSYLPQSYSGSAVGASYFECLINFVASSSYRDVPPATIRSPYHLRAAHGNTATLRSLQ